MTGVYEPSPKEISDRARLLRRMQGAEWAAETIDNVMLRDSPEASVADALIAVYGAKGAKERIERFNAD